MSKKKGTEDPQREALLKSMKTKKERFKRAMDGDVDALIECSYERGLCTREQFEDYLKIKKEYGNEEEEI